MLQQKLPLRAVARFGIISYRYKIMSNLATVHRGYILGPSLGTKILCALDYLRNILWSINLLKGRVA